MRPWRTDFYALSGGNISISGDSLHIGIDNEPLETNEYAFETEGDYVAEEYLVLEYAAFGLLREHVLHAPFLLGENGSAYETLCELNDVSIDGARRRIVVPVKEHTRYSKLKIRFTVKAPHAYLKLFRLYTCRFDDLPVRFDHLRGQPEQEGFTTVPLDALFNASMPPRPDIIDGSRDLPEGDVILSGIPFRFGSPRSNRIAPGPASAENNDEVINFGVPATRRQCRPISRDDAITVPVSGTAQEIVFAAALSGTVHERWGYCAKDPTILGAAVGEVMMPLQAKDVERFQVEIVYENGLHDTAFPYNLMLKRHVITGETGLYAVPAGLWPIQSVIFRNRMIDTDVSILAVTLNRSALPLIPAPGITTVCPPPITVPDIKAACPPPITAPDEIRQSGTLLTIVSGALRLLLDIGDGLHVVSLENGYAPKSSVSGDLLMLRLPDGTVTGRFETCVLSLTDKTAELSCRQNDLACTVTLSVEGNGTLGLDLQAVNTGLSEISCGILFPVLDEVSFADWQDSWYLFPKYQNALSNGHIGVFEESAPSFPMQFFDLFSASQNGGLGILTKEKELTVRKYALTKDDTDIHAYVEYPSMYLKLQPGERFDASSAEIFVHAGDWRCAFRRYRDWLSTWYKPYKSQNKDWYRSCFWLMAEITDFYETEAFTHLPPWYDKKTGEYAFKRIMDEQKSLYGCYPDILHLWAWTQDEEIGHPLWGHFGDLDYDRIGGLEPFTKALRSCSGETGAAVSLYLHPTLLSEVYPEAKDYMPELLVKHKSGSVIGIYDDTFRMCHADKRWRDHVMEMYRRVWRETGIRILYVDEFSLRVDNRCYSEKHGHAVPSNLLKTDREFISELRETMPEEVVLYGEYAAVDVNARYIDCNITYHILDSIRDMIETSWIADDGDDTLGRVYLDLYRFAFPGIVQLVLPMAMRYLSWQPLKSTFFNAEAIYDSFWDAEESRGKEFMAKSFRLKKKYADCFISDSPEPFLDSPLRGVRANRFPGGERTLYTLYNSAYETRRGVLLELPDQPGVVYFDAWNDCLCETERSGDRIRILGCIGAQEVGCIVAEAKKKRTRKKVG